ncbi:MAG: aminoacyl-tRNA hydrolase [Candidatus Thiodiazotropha sp. (ex Myrtea sp. 'scaly one' KF741663)]|nr:aminoacyl-tRNA hydrolase [Candidatus Thiodiazotropha sp. (ex Myrtea sp. 'scaly one' KF741663)]
MRTDDTHLSISSRVSIPLSEIELIAVRASGPGGQNVNKVSSAIHLRFSITESSLPDLYKQRLFKLQDKRITRAGVIIIKAQNYRDQEKNRADALERLKYLIQSVATTRKKRIATKPSKASQKRRIDSKKRHGQQKALRRKPLD